MSIDSLISQTVEFEGLLRVLRDRKSPAVRTLVEEKFATLSDEFKAFINDDGCDSDPVLKKATIIEPQSSVVEAVPAAAFVVEATQPSAPVEAGAAVPPAPPELFDDIIILDEPVAEGHDVEEHSAVDTPEEMSVSGDAVEDGTVTGLPETETEPSGDAPDSESVPLPPVQPLSRPESVKGDLLKAFTVNDRFLFIRELFHGDRDDFSRTVSIIAAMPDIEEAREFIYQDLMWDSDNPAVASFVELVGRYLPARNS